jgi:hypothetical protein
MLMRAPAGGPDPHRNPRHVRRLWHDESRNSPALGCDGCPEKKLCGGICAAAAYFDCLSYCCNKPAACGSVCRLNPRFADRIWEIRGFDLSNVPRKQALLSPGLPRSAPIVFHGNNRSDAASPPYAALPLCAMFRRRSGRARTSSPEELRNIYRLVPATRVLLTGTDEDSPIERWWELGAPRRAAIIGAMRQAGVSMTTTPNYSLTLNVPRWDDLYAMKRIGLVHAEFLAEGMPAALHVNGRTDTDFKRWAEFIAARDEVTHVAYEFTTGSGWAGRRRQHAAWLTGLAADVGRPLHLVVRGGVDMLHLFTTAFAGVTFLESDSFMKTVKRRRAQLLDNGRITWTAAPTEPGAPLDELLAANMATMQRYLEFLVITPPSGSASAGHE